MKKGRTVFGNDPMDGILGTVTNNPTIPKIPKLEKWSIQVRPDQRDLFLRIAYWDRRKLNDLVIEALDIGLNNFIENRGPYEDLPRK